MSSPVDQPSRLIIVLGSGPGIGTHVAAEFASRGFNKIALLSRNASRLADDVAFVRKATKDGNNVDVRMYPTDLAVTEQIETSLSKILKELGKPEVVVFNAAMLEKSKLFEYKESDLETGWKITTQALYTTARILAPALESLASAEASSVKPTLLVTSGGLYKQPYHPFFALAQSKSSQFNLTMSISQVLKPKGVHVAAIVVHGIVKEGDPIFAPAKVAQTYWKVYQESTEKEVWITDGKGWQPVL